MSARTGERTPAPRPGAGPARVDRVQRDLSRRLTAWAVACLAAGAATAEVGRRRGDARLAAFGRQSAAWGAVDAVIAVVAGRRPATGDPGDRARRLRRLLRLNAAADVGYVASGVAWARRGGRTATGNGAAVVVQGLFLLALDVAGARALRRGG